MAPVNKSICISCLGPELYYATDYLFTSTLLALF